MSKRSNSYTNFLTDIEQMSFKKDEVATMLNWSSAPTSYIMEMLTIFKDTLFVTIGFNFGMIAEDDRGIMKLTGIHPANIHVILDEDDNFKKYKVRYLNRVYPHDEFKWLMIRTPIMRRAADAITIKRYKMIDNIICNDSSCSNIFDVSNEY